MPETYRGNRPPEDTAAKAACRCEDRRHRDRGWKWAHVRCDDGEYRTVAWQDCAKGNARAYINNYLRTGGVDAIGQEAQAPQAQSQQAEQTQQQQDEAHDGDNDDAAGPSSTRDPAAAEAKAKWVAVDEANLYHSEETDGVARSGPYQPLRSAWSTTRPKPENYYQPSGTDYTGGDLSYEMMPPVPSRTRARPEDYYHSEETGYMGHMGDMGDMGDVGDMGDMGDMGEMYEMEETEEEARHRLGVLPSAWTSTQRSQY